MKLKQQEQQSEKHLIILTQKLPLLVVLLASSNFGDISDHLKSVIVHKIMKCIVIK